MPTWEKNNDREKVVKKIKNSRKKLKYTCSKINLVQNMNVNIPK